MRDKDLDVKPPFNCIMPFFQWDNNKISKNIQIFEDQFKCQVKEGPGFKTVLGSQAFTPGRCYYFEVILVKGFMFKIGISRKTANYEQAFCDTLQGWGLSNGELRHNSKSEGRKYGEKIKAGDVIGVALDMIEGKLGFFHNGNWQGIAFEEEALKQGKLYPACALRQKQDQIRLQVIRED